MATTKYEAFHQSQQGYQQVDSQHQLKEILQQVLATHMGFQGSLISGRGDMDLNTVFFLLVHSFRDGGSRVHVNR